jgi:uncharacterized membrane protein
MEGHPTRKSPLWQLLRENFFAGLLVIAPIAVIGWILLLVVQTVWQLHDLFPTSWLPESITDSSALSLLTGAVFTFAATLLLAIGVSGLGWASKHYLGKKTLDALEETIERIPVIRSIYSALNQLLRAITAGGGQQFSRVVYVEYPRAGCWTLAFVTGATQIPGENTPALSLYVPTTPNPTSGFYLIVPERDVRESHLSVEDAFKVILSLGIAHKTQ